MYVTVTDKVTPRKLPRDYTEWIVMRITVQVCELAYYRTITEDDCYPAEHSILLGLGILVFIQ